MTDSVEKDLDRLSERVNKLETGFAMQEGASRVWREEVIRRQEEAGRDRTQFRIDLSEGISQMRELASKAITEVGAQVTALRGEVREDVLRLQTEYNNKIETLTKESNKKAEAVQNWATRILISVLTGTITLIVSGVISYIVYFSRK